MLVNQLLLATSFGSFAAAASHKVAVGSGGLKYDPSSLTAAVGDTVEFDFSGVKHDVVQSSFESPCSPSTNGFSVPPQSSSSMTFTITVNDTNPIYFYCSVANHCMSGMVGIINPASDKSQSDFANAAKTATTSEPNGNNAVGGVLSNGSSGGSSSASSSGSSSKTASSSGGSSATSSGSASSSASAASSSSKAGAIATAIPAALAVVAGAVAACL